MQTVIGSHAANATFEFTIRVNLTLDPGAWLVDEQGITHSVTSVRGMVDADGSLHLAFPKGVQRRQDGEWGVLERILRNAIPRSHPDAAWDAMPGPVRDLLQDAYLLAIEDIPAAVGAVRV